MCQLVKSQGEEGGLQRMQPRDPNLPMCPPESLGAAPQGGGRTNHRKSQRVALQADGKTRT